MRCVAECGILLDRLVLIGDHGRWEIRVPSGLHPVFAVEREGRVGRLIIIFDMPRFEFASVGGYFEPLTDVQGSPLLITGDIGARRLEERAVQPAEQLRSLIVDEAAQANVLALDGAAEVAWWYDSRDGRDQREDEGICALDLIFDRTCHPLDEASPQRNLAALVAQFLEDHGPPSLR